MTRLARWIRGDYQIINWLKKKKGLNKLSRFKILDNIRRSLLEIAVVLNIIVILLFKAYINPKVFWITLITLISIVIPSILEGLNYIIFRKENVKKQRKFTKSIEGIEASFYRAVIAVMTLPTKAYMSLDATIRTIYRMSVSKEHLLEWTTSEEADKQDKNKLITVYIKMLPNVIISLIILGIIIFASCSILFKIFIYALATLWLTAPLVMWDISKENIHQNKIKRLTSAEQTYIKNVARKTWDYFEEYMNKENSYLPPDNFQESRREKSVDRTSSTNIGLGLLTIISAYDLEFITLEKTIISLENTLDTVQKLEKWNGHLYNWYNIRNLKPLIPKYVSTVDSGNFVRIFIYIKIFFRG